MHAIAQAEKATSGEIRVHLEEKCGDDVIKRATQIFAKLNMHKTCLLYTSPSPRDRTRSRMPSSA